MPAAFCTFLPEVPKPLQTPSYRKGTPWVPASQVGGGEDGETGLDISSRLPQSSSLLLKSSKKANAAREYLPLAAWREARNLQNLFPLLRLPEEKALELEDDAEEEPLPGNCLDDWWLEHLEDGICLTD